MLDQPQLPAARRIGPERSFKEEVRALRLGEGDSENLSKTLASIAATTTTLRHAAE